MFNRVRNRKDAHALWSDICALHEGTKSEREERYHLVMKKLNSFGMLPKESANEMYSRLNILVNGLELTQMQPSDVVIKILSVLPIDKYGHIMTVLHQGDLSTATPTQILGKINAHEMYIHIIPQDGSSSTKKKDKDLAFKASQEKGKARIEYESSSDEKIDDASLKALVWFWWIDETLSDNLVYQSDYEIGGTTPSNEEIVKIMMMVMPWWWSSAWTWKEEREK